MNAGRGRNARGVFAVVQNGGSAVSGSSTYGMGPLLSRARSEPQARVAPAMRRLTLGALLLACSAGCVRPPVPTCVTSVRPHDQRREAKAYAEIMRFFEALAGQQRNIIHLRNLKAGLEDWNLTRTEFSVALDWPITPQAWHVLTEGKCVDSPQRLLHLLTTAYVALKRRRQHFATFSRSTSTRAFKRSPGVYYKSPE